MALGSLDSIGQLDSQIKFWEAGTLFMAPHGCDILPLTPKVMTGLFKSQMK
jgi:hypothetical protein